jgi:hypothetical protein
LEQTNLLIISLRYLLLQHKLWLELGFITMHHWNKPICWLSPLGTYFYNINSD